MSDGNRRSDSDSQALENMRNRVGSMLDGGFDHWYKKDGLKLTKLSMKVEEWETFLIVGCVNIHSGAEVVAFYTGLTPLTALCGFEKKLAAGKVRWKIDIPWEERPQKSE